MMAKYVKLNNRPLNHVKVTFIFYFCLSRIEKQIFSIFPEIFMGKNWNVAHLLAQCPSLSKVSTLTATPKYT